MRALLCAEVSHWLPPSGPHRQSTGVRLELINAARYLLFALIHTTKMHCAAAGVEIASPLFFTHVATRYLRLSGIESSATRTPIPSQARSPRIYSSSSANSSQETSAVARIPSVQADKSQERASLSKHLPADKESHRGDMNGRIAELQLQSQEALAVLDASSQKQVHVLMIALRGCR